MKHNISCAVLILIVFILFPLPIQAENNRIKVLEKVLEQRDKVILELLDRVETLEQRAGIKKYIKDTAKTAKPGAIKKKKLASETERKISPGLVVVKEEEAERALERALAMDGVLLLSAGTVEIEPGFSYARNEDATPAYFNSGGTLFAAETEKNADRYTANLALRFGLPWDSQVEIGLPYLWRKVETVTNVGFSAVQVSDQSGSGLGDIQIGLAKTLVRETLWRPDLIARVTWYTDSGTDSDNGVSLGGGYHELKGALTAIKRKDPLAFVAGLSYEHSFAKNQIQPGSTISANFGSYLALSPETSLHFFFSVSDQQEVTFQGNEIAGSTQRYGSFTVGGSTLLAPGFLMNLSMGIGLTDDADDFSTSLSFPFRFHYQ